MLSSSIGSGDRYILVWRSAGRVWIRGHRTSEDAHAAASELPPGTEWEVDVLGFARIRWLDELAGGRT